MKLGIGFSPRVLLCDARAVLEMRAHRLPERLVVGEAPASSSDSM
jgi:hypothetical protein